MHCLQFSGRFLMYDLIAHVIQSCGSVLPASWPDAIVVIASPNLKCRICFGVMTVNN